MAQMVMVRIRDSATRLEGRIIQEDKSQIVLFSDLLRQEFTIPKRLVKEVRSCC